jgi:hypothetical protein
MYIRICRHLCASTNDSYCLCAHGSCTRPKKSGGIQHPTGPLHTARLSALSSPSSTSLSLFLCDGARAWYLPLPYTNAVVRHGLMGWVECESVVGGLYMGWWFQCPVQIECAPERCGFRYFFLLIFVHEKYWMNQVVYVILLWQKNLVRGF